MAGDGSGIIVLFGLTSVALACIACGSIIACVATVVRCAKGVSDWSARRQGGFFQQETANDVYEYENENGNEQTFLAPQWDI